MATYPTITDLGDLDTTLPAGGESASSIDEAMRQTRQAIKTLLGVAHNNDGTLKAGSLSAGNLQQESVSGSNDNSGATKNNIQHGTIATPDLKDDAVTTAKIAALAVTAAELAAGAVTAAKLASLAVGNANIQNAAVDTDELADLAVATAKLDDLAVTTAKLGDLAVTTAKLADGGVTPAKLSNVGSNQLMVGTGSAVEALTLAGQVSAVKVGSTLELRLASTGELTGAVYAKCAYSPVSGTAGTAIVTGSLQLFTGLTEEVDVQDIIVVSGGLVTLRAAGVYFITWGLMGYNAGNFITELTAFPPSAAESRLARGGNLALPANSGGWSRGTVLYESPEDSTVLRLKYEASNAGTIGNPCSFGENEHYAELIILRLA